MESIYPKNQEHLSFTGQIQKNILALGVLLSLAAAFLVWVAPLNWLIGLFLGVAATAGLLLLLRHPVMGIPLVLMFAPLAAYEARAGIPFVGFLPISLGQIAFIGLIALWVLTRLIKREVCFPQAKSFTWLLLFAGLMIVTTLPALSTADGAKEVIKWIQLGLMMLICLDLTRYAAKDWQLLNHGIWLPVSFLVIGGLSQSIIGISQFVNPNGPESFQILGRFSRAFGTFEQPNPFGGYIAWHFVFFTGLILPSLTNRLMHFIQPKQKLQDENLHWLPTAGFIVIILLFGVALVASWSRGAWLAAVAGLATITLFLPKDRKTGILLILTAILGIVILWQSGLLPNSITSRLASSTQIEFIPVRDQEVSPANFAVLERQAFWQAAFSMFESNIWTGVGFGNYDAAYPDHFVGTWERSLGHAHNYYINLLAETGIVGLLAYLIFWAVIVCQLLFILPNLD
ncbi:MAG: O-antigen ligase family protein, partial [Chloroflexota bacterium]